MKHVVVGAVLGFLVTLALLWIFVPYSYATHHDTLVRVNRFTGEIEFLDGELSSVRWTNIHHGLLK